MKNAELRSSDFSDSFSHAGNLRFAVALVGLTIVTHNYFLNHLYGPPKELYISQTTRKVPLLIL